VRKNLLDEPVEVALAEVNDDSDSFQGMLEDSDLGPIHEPPECDPYGAQCCDGPLTPPQSAHSPYSPPHPRAAQDAQVPTPRPGSRQNPRVGLPFVVHAYVLGHAHGGDVLRVDMGMQGEVGEWAGRDHARPRPLDAVAAMAKVLLQGCSTSMKRCSLVHAARSPTD